MSVQDVKSAFARVAQDKRIDQKEVDEIYLAAGTVSRDEQAEIDRSVRSAQYKDMMDRPTRNKFDMLSGQATQYRAQAAVANSDVADRRTGLMAETESMLKAGVATRSFGGTVLPEEVKSVVREALQNGATAYDVVELKSDPVFSAEHGDPELGLDGKFNPYAQEQNAVDSVTFSHTELTPARFEKDMNTVQTFNIIDGYSGGTNGEATFKQVTQKGAGNVTTRYDEATWSDTFARGEDGATHASNFAILSDGTIHAIPASRRTSDEPWRILTTASLGRGKLMLFNGHLEVEGGVVTSIGLSGRLCKLRDRGEAKFIDPIPLLKAWGFKLAPGLTVRDEG